MTSSLQKPSPPQPPPPPPASHEKRTSIAWTNLPEPSESRVGRQSSLAFASGTSPGLTGANASGSGSGPASIRSGRSLSSPPPPPSFLKRVSFDTFDNKDAPFFSLTLKSKHKDYSYTRRSRTFLCGTDQNEYSDFALEWLIDELVDDGDEIVCLRVVDKDSRSGNESSTSEEKQYRREARDLLNDIIEKNKDDKAISIILEFSVGKVHETIQRMIHIYEPVILVVGTRGRSLGGLQGLLPGSVSKYCLQHSPIPVIVVRPSTKREKKKDKRQRDPGRRVYQEMIETDKLLMNHANSSHKSVSAVSGVSENLSSTSLGSAGDGITDVNHDHGTPVSLGDTPSPGSDIYSDNIGPGKTESATALEATGDVRDEEQGVLLEKGVD